MHPDPHDPNVLAPIRQAAQPFDDDAALAAIAVDAVRDARLVLIGEASHGSSEFYRARAAITRALIEAGRVNAVALEADWPDALRINRFRARRRWRLGGRRARRVRTLPHVDVAERGGARLHHPRASRRCSTRSACRASRCT